jgi:energy-coupling factor transporter transmembrane protein EcfT
VIISKGSLVKFVRTTPSLNGKYEASPIASGASAIATQRTSFPEDHPQVSLRTLLYYASRYRLGSASLFRWLLFGLVVTGAVVTTGLLPGRWWWLSLCVLLLASLLLLFTYWRRRDFVRFEPSAAPTISPQHLPAQEKAPVMVTGFFSVEQKFQRFTWLPGFYRTFATREHALLCQVMPHAWAGLVHWPEEEIGLWYIFFLPSDILQLQWGQLFFGADARPAIAVTHRVVLGKPKRFRSEQTRDEKVYIAFETATAAETVWADLLHDFPTGAPQTA